MKYNVLFNISTDLISNKMKIETWKSRKQKWKNNQNIYGAVAHLDIKNE